LPGRDRRAGHRLVSQDVGMPADVLLILAKYPQPGRCKTRLVPELGAEGAAELHRRMVQQTLDVARSLIEEGTHVEVWFAGADAPAMAAMFGEDFNYRLQHGEDLGQRLRNAFAAAFQAGARRVIAIGTDCLELAAGDVRTGFDDLHSHDVVLGPARDGGYYLIGASRHLPRLFEAIAWGTEIVARQTIDRIHEQQLTAALLPMKQDVDRPEDLPRATAMVDHAAHGEMPPRLSVIIPTLHHEARLADLLRRTTAAADVQTIVVASGRVHHSLAEAAHHGVRLLCSRPGRAAQLNLGAANATADVLLFVHADTLLPDGFALYVEQTLQAPHVVAGAFTLGIDAHGWRYRLIEAGVRARSKWLRFPYGDQALFLRREVFEAVGGFPDWPLMEDYELVRRLRRIGSVQVCEASVRTSGRRWRTLGAWRTTLVNQLIVAAYHCGVSPQTLARWYGVRTPTVPQERQSEMLETGRTGAEAAASVEGDAQRVQLGEAMLR